MNMKSKKIILSVLTIATFSLATVSCDKTKNQNINKDVVDTEQSVESETPIDESSVFGVYFGVLPCASCPGIETTITLNEDGTYERVENYLENEDADDSSKGEIVWIDNKTKISLGDYTYMVKENQLIMLNSDGELPKGELAEAYVLNKKSK